MGLAPKTNGSQKLRNGEMTDCQFYLTITLYLLSGILFIAYLVWGQSLLFIGGLASLIIILCSNLRHLRR